MSQTIDKHILMEVGLWKRLEMLCLHKGDLTYNIQLAIKEWVEKKERQLEEENKRLMQTEV